MSQSEEAPPRAHTRGRWRWAALAVLLTAAACWFLWDGLREAMAQSAKTRCITNERRISSALLLYSQDHDGRLPPPEYETATSSGLQWRTWFGLLQSYLPPDERFVCPRLDIHGTRERGHGYEFPTSYAMNGRFYDTFGPGPFPLENLELPAQTAMLVEAGAYHDLKGGDASLVWLSPVYRDIAGHENEYPSPHSGRMNVAAADGHVATLKLAHYRPDGHDPVLGRMGGSIYNWNGGHPNGDTGGPPRE